MAIGRRSATPSRRYLQILSVSTILLLPLLFLGSDLYPAWRKVAANIAALGIGFGHLASLLLPTWIPFLFGKGRIPSVLHAAMVAVLAFCLSADLQYYLMSGLHAQVGHLRLLFQPDTAVHMGGGGTLFRGVVENVLFAEACLLLPIAGWKAGRDGR